MQRFDESGMEFSSDPWIPTVKAEKPPVSDGPIQIIETDEEDHSFHLNESALASILLRPEIADKKVAVVSVAGAFRKGKSFLLNFFLQYLRSRASNHSGSWFGSEDDIVDGFSWRGGSERDTSGILIWKDPFVLQMADGEEIAVLLMDTQGAFDSQSTVKDCATVFALSTMISSLQIYNLSQNIQEDDLQHLQLFTEYGRLALEDDCTARPFQALLFLVRDWSFPYEAEYGFEGGERILERRLQLSEKQHTELQQLRKHIKSCFDRIQCFLMPHPGLRVATSPQFKGQLSEVESEFKTYVAHLVDQLMAPESLVLKELNGNKITCRQLVDLFQSYIKIFQGEELPEPKSMLLATAEANNLAAVTSSRAHYNNSMDDICGGDTPYLNQNDLEDYHCRYREESLQNFVDIRKMGGDEFSEQFLEKLDTEIMDQFDNYVKINNSKNLFRSVKTPTVLFVVLIVDYLIKEIMEVLYLDFLARILSSFLGIILLTISLWGYIRYSGNMREMGQSIDGIANTIWDNVLNPLSNYAMTEGVKKVTNLQQSLGTQNSGDSGRTRQPNPSSKKVT